jgi:hypothetical protein
MKKFWGLNTSIHSDIFYTLFGNFSSWYLLENLFVYLEIQNAFNQSKYITVTLKPKYILTVLLTPTSNCLLIITYPPNVMTGGSAAIVWRKVFTCNRNSHVSTSVKLSHSWELVTVAAAHFELYFFLDYSRSRSCRNTWEAANVEMVS